MPTANNFKPLLHRKQWALCSPPAANTSTGSVCVKNRLHNQFVYWIRSASIMEMYDPNQDAWGTMPSPNLTPFGAGACAEASAIGPTGTATAGTTTTITTNLNIPVDLRGYQIRINSGPGAGDWRTIQSNTLGANSVITVTSAFSAAITSSSNFTLLTGRVYMFGGGALAGTNSFRVFDFATQSQTGLTITGLPATFGTDAVLVATPSIVDLGVVNSYATGTATGGTTTTLVNSSKAWATNQWANAYQVRITAGTGVGQIRRITSNTGTTLTVPTWTTAPDATSVYSIEGDDDSLYLMGNATLTLYRYSISGNAWSTVAPAVARTAGGYGAGLSGCWVSRSPAQDWTDENNIRNGRRIYSFRGGAATALDYYDIPSNSWINAVQYGPLTITPTTGWKCIEYKNRWFIRNTGASAALAQWYVFDFETHQLTPWNSFNLLSNVSVVGQTPFIAEYTDGPTTVPFLYAMTDNSTFPNLIRTYIGY